MIWPFDAFFPAEDSLQFVIRWMERFPRYKHREVYITGESYAGHYVPQLAQQILRHNSKSGSSSSSSSINFKGIMVFYFRVDTYANKNRIWTYEFMNLIYCRWEMQWQIITMTTLELWHIGGVTLWYLIKRITNSLTHVILNVKRIQMNVNHYIVMLWIKSLEISINTTFMHPLVTTLMVATRVRPVKPCGCPIGPIRYLLQFISY